MEDALGLLLRRDLLCEPLVLVGVVQGKPMRVTLWTGAKRPYLGMHWKYLRGTRRHQLKPLVLTQTHSLTVLSPLPGPCHGTVVLAERFIQFHSTPLSLGKVCLSQKPNHSGLCPTNLQKKKGRVDVESEKTPQRAASPLFNGGKCVCCVKSEFVTSTRSPSLSSLLVFFWDSGSERFDSVDIWLSTAIVFMPLT